MQITMSNDEEFIANRIHGGFLGRVIGSTMGSVVEGRRYEDIKVLHGTIDHYVGFKPDDQGHIIGIPNDDEMFEIVLLMALEEKGKNATSQDIANRWLDLIAPNFTFTAEKVALERFQQGIFVFGEDLVQGNPYHDFIGAQMRAELPGWVYPANQDAATELARIDAEVSHAREGITGELFVTAMITNAFAVPSNAASPGKVEFSELMQLIEKGKAVIPPESLYAMTIAKVEALYHEEPEDWERNFLAFREFAYGELLDMLCADPDADQARQDTLRRLFHIHVLPNAGILMLALLHGQGDFSKSLEICADCGLDADCNCGNVGGILGTMLGPENIPDEWKGPLNNQFYTLIKDYEEDRLDVVARRISDAAGKLLL
jgi:ADP-ribosylglycohydrolase